MNTTLGAENTGCERPIDSASAPPAPRAEVWRFVRCRVNPSAGSLCTNPSEVRIERGTLEKETQRATFFRQVLQGEGSLYDAAQRLFEKKFTILRDGLDNFGVLFRED